MKRERHSSASQPCPQRALIRAAQTYPVKPVRIVVPQAPGAQSDLFARLLGQKLGESLGQSVISDPRPGAGGAIGAELAARAAPDGHTLLMGTNSTHGSNPALYAKLPYDPIKDFAPITLTQITPYMLTVHPSLPVTTLKQLIAFAKSKPAQLNYASAGNGSTHHLCGELLKSMAGIDHHVDKGAADTASCDERREGDAFSTERAACTSKAAEKAMGVTVRGLEHAARSTDDDRGGMAVSKCIVVRIARTAGKEAREQPHTKR